MKQDWADPIAQRPETPQADSLYGPRSLGGTTDPAQTADTGGLGGAQGFGSQPQPSGTSQTPARGEESTSGGKPQAAPPHAEAPAPAPAPTTVDVATLTNGFLVGKLSASEGSKVVGHGLVAKGPLSGITGPFRITYDPATGTLSSTMMLMPNEVSRLLPPIMKSLDPMALELKGQGQDVSFEAVTKPRVELVHGGIAQIERLEVGHAVKAQATAPRTTFMMGPTPVSLMGGTFAIDSGQKPSCIGHMRVGIDVISSRMSLNLIYDDTGVRFIEGEASVGPHTFSKRIEVPPGQSPWSQLGRFAQPS